MSIVTLFICAADLVGQGIRSYSLSKTESSPLPKSNSIDEMVVRKDTVWVGSSRGLSITLNGGLSWNHFDKSFGFREQSISAIAMNDNIIWVSEATSLQQEGDQLPVGVGLYYSVDGGKNWSFVPQPVDKGTIDTLKYGINKIRTLAITTTVNNITYDIALRHLRFRFISIRRRVRIARESEPSSLFRVCERRFYNMGGHSGWHQ